MIQNDPVLLRCCTHLRRPARQGQRYHDSVFLLELRSVRPVYKADDMLWHFERRLKQAVQRMRMRKGLAKAQNDHCKPLLLPGSFVPPKLRVSGCRCQCCWLRFHHHTTPPAPSISHIPHLLHFGYRCILPAHAARWSLFPSYRASRLTEQILLGSSRCIERRSGRPPREPPEQT